MSTILAAHLHAGLQAFDFTLPDALVAREPAEARGLTRDGVRLLVSHVPGDMISHERFLDLPDFLDEGDLLVVNASATVNAALEAWREGPEDGDGDRIAVHVSSPVPAAYAGLGGHRGVRTGPIDVDKGTQWVVELRRLTPDGTAPLLTGRRGERIRLPAGVTATVAVPFVPLRAPTPADGRTRLWVANIDFPGDALRYLGKHGWPIRYKYLSDQRQLADYQTVFASEPGSAEMPSAGRPFTHAMIERLEQKGVRIAPVILHTGVSSLEYDEPPYPERFRVPAETADAVNRARAAGGRIIAVGTTSVRALETVASADGRVQASEGWTDLIIDSGRGVRAVDGILTGFHEPRSSHLAMLEAVAGRRHLVVTYSAALRHRYLWHEFGDVHLILRARPRDG